jgi:hypothetical protein
VEQFLDRAKQRRVVDPHAQGALVHWKSEMKRLGKVAANFRLPERVTRRGLKAAVPITVAFLLVSTALSPAAAPVTNPPPAWASAHTQGPMGPSETRAFMKQLTQFIFENHLRRDNSPMRGMVYEYFDPSRKGQFDQFVQGEALDTMHDGAWFAIALVNAHRATGDPFYKVTLTQWVLPFYLKMLNHSDELFRSSSNDARTNAAAFNKEHALQPGEKGFVPYWWDDGGSVSLERRRDRNPLGPFPCTDNFAGKPNTNSVLNGYSHGSSNHLAQDLGAMLQMAWLLLKDSKDAGDRALTEQVVQAIRNLYESRLRHHGKIPMCSAPMALATADTALLKTIPEMTWQPVDKMRNHYLNALAFFTPGKKMPFPGFADDQQYRYYSGLARDGGLKSALAFRVIYDAFTEPSLYRYYSDDGEVPPGINVFDLHPYSAADGRPQDHRSERQGPGGQARPIGSRFGPQNLVTSGWALQMLQAFPGVWEEPYRRSSTNDHRVYITGWPPNYIAVKLPPLEPLKVGNVTLKLGSSKRSLLLEGETTNETVTIKLFSQPEAQGGHITISIKRDNQASVLNEKGETLQFNHRAIPNPGGFAFGVQIPYLLNPGQKSWFNVVEHGRYSLQVGEARRNLYFASRERGVTAWLDVELNRGLQTWNAIFKEKGFIPSGLGTGQEFDRLSDSGGYAHLISAGAQWLLYQDRRTDWQVNGFTTLPGK